MAPQQPLRARAAAAKSTDLARPEGNGNAAARPEDPNAAGIENLAGLLERYRGDFEAVLPKHLSIDRLLRIATVALRQTPDLALSTPKSFLGALMTCTQLGLEPGPLGEAYLLPFKDKNIPPHLRVCTFVPGYQGLIKLAYQSGQIASFAAETVHEHDTFAVYYGSNRRIEHVRPKLGVDRGKAIGWYALAGFASGGEAFVVMDRPEVERIRARSRAANSGPWVTDYDAMAKKTCVRQLSKWLPKSTELAIALAQDGAERTDLAPTALAIPGRYVAGEIEAGDAGAGESVDTTTGLITERPTSRPVKQASGEQLNAITTAMDERGLTNGDRRAWVEAQLNRDVSDPSALTYTEAEALLAALAEPAFDDANAVEAEVLGETAGEPT